MFHENVAWFCGARDRSAAAGADACAGAGAPCPPLAAVVVRSFSLHSLAARKRQFDAEVTYHNGENIPVVLFLNKLDQGGKVRREPPPRHAPSLAARPNDDAFRTTPTRADNIFLPYSRAREKRRAPSRRAPHSFPNDSLPNYACDGRRRLFAAATSLFDDAAERRFSSVWCCADAGLVAGMVVLLLAMSMATVVMMVTALAPKLAKDELDAFCAAHGFVAWFPCSAKTGENVEIAFSALTSHVMGCIDLWVHEDWTLESVFLKNCACA